MTFLGTDRSPCCSCHLLYDVVYVSGFAREDTVDLELNVTSRLMCGLCHD
jgi:hypothetical protein